MRDFSFFLSENVIQNVIMLYYTSVKYNMNVISGHRTHCVTAMRSLPVTTLSSLQFTLSPLC